MPTGHCYCGNIKIEYTGDPKASALCHCSDCRHYTSSLFSHNLIISNSHFKVSGTPKEMTVTAASGKSITNCFCGTCGTVLYRYGDSFGGIDGDKILQAGCLDDLDEIIRNKPKLEMFVEGRVDWVHSLEDGGVAQFVGMPSAPPKE